MYNYADTERDWILSISTFLFKIRKGWPLVENKTKSKLPLLITFCFGLLGGKTPSVILNKSDISYQFSDTFKTYFNNDEFDIYTLHFN